MKKERSEFPTSGHKNDVGPSQHEHTWRFRKLDVWYDIKCDVRKNTHGNDKLRLASLGSFLPQQMSNPMDTPLILTIGARLAPGLKYFFS